MRTLLTRLLVGIVAVSSLAGPVWAGEECPPGTFTRVIGTVQTANSTDAGAENGYQEISQQGQKVRRITVTCGSACVAGLYDSDTTFVAAGNNPMAAAYVKAEPGAPANESRSLDFDPPLQFVDGVSFRDDSNVAAVILYTCGP